MNNHYALSVTLASIVTLTSCTTESSKKPVETESRSEKHGKVIHFEELVALRAPQGERGGENAIDVLNQTLKENPKVVLDFYAEWCGPCQKLTPIFEKLATRHTDVLFIKINVETFDSVREKFGVKSLPTLMFYKNGDRKEKITGFKSESDLKTLLKKLD